MTQRLDAVFDLRYGHSLELVGLEKVQPPTGVNFVSRAMGNNGVTGRVVAPCEPGAAGELTVALSGNGVLSTFLQPEPFVTGFHVMILRAKDPEMTDVEKLWWARCIWENRHLYSYGRQANRTLGGLELPDAAPKWIKTVAIPTIEGLAGPAGEAKELSDPSAWKPFRLDLLFDIQKGRRLTKADRQPGAVRFIGASEKRNGVTDLADVEPTFQPGCLTVAYNGSVGQTFYQDEPFFACDDVNVLIPYSPRTRLELLFVAGIIKHQKIRYTYGYKWTLKRMKATEILLPVTAAGEPDWEWMGNYMAGLPFSSIIARTEPAVPAPLALSH